MMYQLSPAASKRNAFCWLSYEPEIEWKANDNGQAKRNEIMERKRAAGVDPLHIPGMSSATNTSPLDPMRFSVMSWSKRP
jgi:hypothetical protein